MNTNHTTTNKSSAELKEQVINDINRVKDDFKEIKNRLTPGQIIDEALFYRKGGVVDPATTFDFLKSNPIGTSFLTIGTILLMEDEHHHSYEAHYKGKIGDMRSRLNTAIENSGESTNFSEINLYDRDDFQVSSGTDSSSRIDSLKESSRSGIESAKSNISASSQNAKSKVKEGIESVKTKFDSSSTSAKAKASSTLENAKSALHSATDKASHGLDSAKGTLSSAASSIKSRSSQAIESSKNLNPMTYMALGAGLGVITGASLPLSSTEERIVNEKLATRMNDFRSEFEDALNQSVNILKNEFIGGMTDVKFNFF